MSISSLSPLSITEIKIYDADPHSKRITHRHRCDGVIYADLMTQIVYLVVKPQPLKAGSYFLARKDCDNNIIPLTFFRFPNKKSINLDGDTYIPVGKLIQNGGGVEFKS